MPLRLLEIVLPDTDSQQILDIIEDESIISYWKEETADAGLLIKILLAAEQTEKILDLLEEKFSYQEGFRVILLSVEATIPRIQQDEVDESAEEEEEGDAEEDNNANNVSRISREELYADIVDSTKFSHNFLAMVILSSVVATVGLMRDNVAVIIGAMVIAPLLGPNVGLALATTLGDFKLGRDALKTNLSGLLIALGLSIFIGLTLTVDPTVSEIASRTQVNFADILVALASGTAGVLAFTAGLSAVLIGVMVAVALLPPVVTFGLLLGSGYHGEALGALLLLITNLICVNLAGVITFLVQGIRPRSWWEANKAQRATRIALIIWSVLLVILIIVITLSQRNVTNLVN